MSSAVVLGSQNFVELPRNRSIIGKLSASKFIVQAKKRVSRFKTSAKVRQRISAGLRRFKVPLLSIGAQLPWALPAISALKTQGGNALNGNQFAQGQIMNSLVSPFIPLKFVWDGQQNVPKLHFGGLLSGLIPNLMLMFTRRFGVFRGINQRLSMNRIPVRLS